MLLLKKMWYHITIPLARLLPTPQKADSGPEKAQGLSGADSGADSPSIYSVRANSPNSLRAAFA